MMETNGPNSEDLNYYKIVIQKAKDRAINESARLVNYEKLKFEDLLAKLPQLIIQGKIFVGFTGGIEALSSVSEIAELVNRSHYKVSDTQWTHNWIPLDMFLHKVFELKGYYNKYNAQDA